MIRPLTCICMLLAGGSGLYLYQSKHQAQMLDREIARTSKATDAARERIGVLRGEWALLNEPDRLAELSQEHLGLKMLTPAQFVTAAELAARLPPPALPGAAPEPAEEDAPAPAAALPEPPQPVAPPPAPAAPAPARTAIAARQPLPTPSQPGAAPPRPPVQVASALPMPAAPLPAPKPVPPRPPAPLVNVSASPIAAPAPPPRPPQARAASPSSAAPTTRPPAPSPDTPAGEAAMRVAQHIPAPGIAAPAAVPGYGALPAVPVSASVLGGARPLLPPPVPYGSAMAASGASAR